MGYFLSTRIFYLGEDYLFWLELSLLPTRIAFSALCECTYGEGVNIVSDSGWGTEKSLIRLHHEMKFNKALPRLFKLGDAQRASNQVTVKNMRRSFEADVLHRLGHREKIDGGLLQHQLKIDPQTFFPLHPSRFRL